MDFIDRIFSEVITVPEIFEKYKRRDLKEGAKVTRVAPSPTGFMHLGGVYAALINERVAHQSGGIFFLRIEDTDTKREAEGAVELICSSLASYEINVDEGFDCNAKEFGNYAPYKQSERREIYKSFIKKMLKDGTAYFCFATEEELNDIRKEQEKQGLRPGYYGKWAIWRNKPIEEVEAKINSGVPFVIRFKSPGNYDNKIVVTDGLKGKISFPENDLDIVIYKGDGLPTYHFAHVIDDYLMGTTHVIRGDEWLSSLPLHIQLFKALGFKAPKYTHIAPIQKMDGESRRKLSKRHDKEADIRFYDKVGYPHDAVIEYLLNLANSSFEGWRKQNPDLSWREFKLEISKLSPSGALFDFVKLDNISKQIIACMSTEEIFNNVYKWAENYEPTLYKLIKGNEEYIKNILSIERTGEKNARKDIAKYADIYEEVRYFFDDEFKLSSEVITELKTIKYYKEIIEEYLKIVDITKTKDEWFEDMKLISNKFGYAVNIKDYKNDPSKYNGNITDTVKIFRILLTGKINSPDLNQIQKVMGIQRVIKRLKAGLIL